MPFQKLLTTISLNPKKIFLVDGLGALLSAFLLGVVLVRFESTFGVPRNTLYFLALLPCIFALYDFYCYLRIKKRLGLFLKIIAFTNLVYCCISIGLAVYHQQELTALGWGYIITEVLIVVTLSFVELKIASKANSSE